MQPEKTNDQTYICDDCGIKMTANQRLCDDCYKAEEISLDITLERIAAKDEYGL